MDHTAGYSAVIATLTALRHRQVTGEGQQIDLSQVEAGAVLCGPAILEKTVSDHSYRSPHNPPGNHAAWPKVAPHNAYLCDGDPIDTESWLMITCENHDQWAALCATAGRDDWPVDPRFATMPARLRNQDILDELITKWTLGQSAVVLMERLQAAGVPAGVVQNLPSIVYNDPQIKSRGFITTNHHELLGEHLTDGTPAKLSRTPAQRRTPGPRLGADNESILGDLLGYDEQARMQLLVDGALG